MQRSIRIIEMPPGEPTIGELAESMIKECAPHAREERLTEREIWAFGRELVQNYKNNELGVAEFCRDQYLKGFSQKVIGEKLGLARSSVHALIKWVDLCEAAADVDLEISLQAAGPWKAGNSAKKAKKLAAAKQLAEESLDDRVLRHALLLKQMMCDCNIAQASPRALMPLAQECENIIHAIHDALYVRLSHYEDPDLPDGRPL
jgi:hypothetical protein